MYVCTYDTAQHYGYNDIDTPCHWPCADLSAAWNRGFLNSGSGTPCARPPDRQADNRHVVVFFLDFLIDGRHVISR